MKTRKQLIKELDDLTRELVKQRDAKYGVCEICQLKPATDDHHIFGRGYAIRWVLEARAYLCRGCHEEAKRNPKFIQGMFAGLRGLAWYNRMEQKANSVKKWTRVEMEEFKEELIEERIELGEDK